MLALTLMVGIVIDDAIIVLENIYRFIEEKNMPPFKAAIEGTKEIGLAVMATTMSLLAVFLPVGFMGGIVGPIHELVRLHFGLRHRGVAAGFVHADADAVLALHQAAEQNRQAGHSSKDSFFFRHLDACYTRMLEWSMAHRKIVVRLSVLVVLTIVPLFMFVGQELSSRGRSIAIQRAGAHAGRHFARRHHQSDGAASRRISGSFPASQHTLMTAGGGADRSVNNASIYVKLTDLDKRQMSQEELMQRTRALLKQVSDRHPYQRRTGEHRRRKPEQCRHAVFHPGSGPGQAGAILR